jgi:hypothetical protein
LRLEKKALSTLTQLRARKMKALSLKIIAAA